MALLTLLANAESNDSTVSNLSTVLICAAIAVGVLILAAVPIMIAWSRRHRHADGLTAVAVLWGLIAAVSVSVSIFDQMKYSREHLMALESGYFDPNDTSDAPVLPLPTWSVLGVVYVALLGWPFLMGGKVLTTPAREEQKT
jgi:hypothetical protein